MGGPRGRRADEPFEADANERRRLAAGPDGQLGKHVAHLMPRRFRADEQAGGDLGVREPLGQQPEDLLLAAAEQTGALEAGPSTNPAPAQEGGCGVGVPWRAEAIELGEGGSRVAHGDLGLGLLVGPGQFQAGPGRLEGHPLGGEARQR